MITNEENQLLTQTNRGAPAGELLRRYWQPVALVSRVALRRRAVCLCGFSAKTWRCFATIKGGLACSASIAPIVAPI